MVFGSLCFIAIFAVASAQYVINAGTSTPAKYSPTYTPVKYQARYDNRDKNDGRYYPDDSGAYHPDGSGAYVHDDPGYRHISGPNGGNNGGSGGNGGYGPGYVPYKEKYVTSRPTVTAASVNTGLKTGSAAGLYDNKNYAIIRKIEDTGLDGYHYLYETENGIFGEEQGQLEQKGSEKEAMHAKGYFKYTGPDNVIYEVEYTADEEGFKPIAAHLPQVPEIPLAIARSLEYQRSIGVLKE